jgi:alanyl-tRNA synthetase
MTDRLYYTDPYLTEFDARIVEVREHAGRPAIVLDRTAFYPASGGQPFDTGVLGSARVVEVIDEEDGSILHIVDGNPAAGPVTGRIDWPRRFEHMQQHTGQHVLSAAFDRLLQVRTVSFHLGSEVSTIDLAREVTPAEITRVEDAANEVVWSDRPVTVRFVDAADAAALPLRKESSRAGLLRIVEVDGFDVSPCGGTHVARTGSIGLVAVSSWERFKGGSRIAFRCGVRALDAHRRLRDIVAAGARLMSAGADELPHGIERLQAEHRELGRRIKDLEGRLSVHEADALAARAEVFGSSRVVIAELAGKDPNALKTIAQHVASHGGTAAVLLTASSPVSLAIARAADVPIDAAALLRALIATFGGRGGGRPELAQGGGLEGLPADVGSAVRALLHANHP